MRVLTYLRVSSQEQTEGYSLSAQRQALVRYIAERDWTLVDEFQDRGASARSADRPQLQELLNQIREDPSIDVLLVHKYDRLCRNMEDYVAISVLLRQYKVQLISATEAVEQNANGELIENLLMVLAQHYSRNLSYEVKKGMRQKVEEGGWANLAPLGYKNVRLESGTRRGDARIVPDEVQAPLVRQAFELYATGQWPLHLLVQEMHRRGLRNKKGGLVGRAKMATVLKARVYIGWVAYDGIEYKGIHEPIVSRELFEKVQEVIATHNRAGERQRRHTHHLRGSVFCGECGARLSTMQAKGKWTYFFCLGSHNRRTECSQPYTPADRLEKTIEDIYKRLVLPADICEEIRHELEKEIVRRESDRGQAAKAWSKRLKELVAERERLLKAYLADAMPLDLFKKEQERIDRETGEAEAHLMKTGLKLDAAREAIEISLRLLENCGRAYARAKPLNRKRWNRTVFKAIYVTDRRISKIEFNEPFGTLLGQGSSKDVLVGVAGIEPATPWL